MTDEQLREWAYRTGDGDVGAAVLRVLEEKRKLQAQVEGHCERIAAQSALLTMRAEHVPLKHPIDESKVFDGTYPMRNTVADLRSKGSGL